jgi:hypothetical protein
MCHSQTRICGDIKGMQQKIVLYEEELLKRAKMLDLLLLGRRITAYPYLNAPEGLLLDRG